MRVREMTLREVQMKLVTPFEISVGRTELRRILLVETSVDGVTGWGECVAGESPSYSPETIDTAWHILRDFLWPLVKEKEFATAADVWDLLAPVRGHRMAKGSLEELVCAVKKELAAGYQRIKIKIKPGKDLEPVRRLRQDFPRIKLMVDANSAYTLNDWPLLKQLEGFYLMMIEQPLGWDDLYSHVELQKKLETPICLDECIHTEEQARAAVELGACKIINIKLGRVGGYTTARRIHDLCQRHGIPVWCGGMLESGIGRAPNIALSTLPNFTLPGDVSASKRYWKEDIIEPEVEVSSQGYIKVPTAPGRGFEIRTDLIEKLTVRKQTMGSRVAV